MVTEMQREKRSECLRVLVVIVIGGLWAIFTIVARPEILALLF